MAYCLIALLFMIAFAAWKGLNKVDEAFTSWTVAALGLITLTLVVASFKVQAVPQGLQVGLTGKLFAEIILMGSGVVGGAYPI